MKILFVSNVFPNPLEVHKGRFNLALLRELARTNEVRVIAPISWATALQGLLRGSRPQPLSDLLDRSRIKAHYPVFYYPPRVCRTRYAWFYWRSINGTVRRVLRDHSPDFVLSYWTHPDGAAGNRIARLAGVPSVVMVGGSDVLLLTQDRQRKKRIQQVLHEADLVLAVSPNIRQKVIELGIDPEKIRLACRGVDGEVFYPGDRTQARRQLGLAEESRVLLWIGRMVPVKGLPVLLEACRLLQSRQVDFQLFLVGDGPDRSALQAFCRQTGLTERVRFVGPVQQDQLGTWYRAADLFVLPSFSEGMPNVLWEALACETPVVCTRVGGIPDMLGPNGDYLVPAGDADGLANRISDFLTGKKPLALPDIRPRSWQQSADELLRQVQSVMGCTVV